MCSRDQRATHQTRESAWCHFHHLARITGCWSAISERTSRRLFSVLAQSQDSRGPADKVDHKASKGQRSVRRDGDGTKRQCQRSRNESGSDFKPQMELRSQERIRVSMERKNGCGDHAAHAEQSTSSIHLVPQGLKGYLFPYGSSTREFRMRVDVDATSSQCLQRSAVFSDTATMRKCSRWLSFSVSGTSSRCCK